MASATEILVDCANTTIIRANGRANALAEVCFRLRNSWFEHFYRVGTAVANWKWQTARRVATGIPRR